MITLLTYFFFVRYVLQRTFSLSVQFLGRLSLLQPSDALLLFSACELFLFSHYARNVLLLSILIQNPIQSSQFEKSIFIGRTAVSCIQPIYQNSLQCFLLLIQYIATKSLTDCQVYIEYYEKKNYFTNHFN